MPVLFFSELVDVVLLVPRCSRAAGVSVSVGDISEEVKSFGGLDKSELCVVTREALLALGVRVCMVELVAVVHAPLSVLFGVVLLDSVPPKALVDREASVSEVAELAGILGDETGVAEVNRRAVRFVAREEAVDVLERGVDGLVTVLGVAPLLLWLNVRTLSSLLELEKEGTVLRTRRGEFLFLRNFFLVAIVVDAVSATLVVRADFVDRPDA